MHRAIDQSDRIKDVLFPTEISLNLPKNFDDEILWVNPQIGNNQEQMTAVKSMLRVSSREPLIVFGPVGTAKSSTLVEAITQIWLQKAEKNPKILLCGPSNNSVDLLVLMLL